MPPDWIGFKVEHGIPFMMMADSVRYNNMAQVGEVSIEYSW